MNIEGKADGNHQDSRDRCVLRYLRGMDNRLEV